MTRPRANAAQALLLDVDAPPVAPASGTRAVSHRPPFRFTWRRAGIDDIVVEVPRRYEGQGEWPGGEPPMVSHSDEASLRAMQRRAERVAAELRGGAREGKTIMGRPEQSKADAAKVRALLLGGALDHHEVGRALGVAASAAAHVLTHLRNTGHVHRAETRARPRKSPLDKGGPQTMGVWALTAQGRAAAKREAAGGGKKSGYNDAGYRSSGRSP